MKGDCNYDWSTNWRFQKSHFKNCLWGLCLYYVCDARYVVTLLDHMLIFHWYMARLVVKNGHQNDICYNETTLIIPISVWDTNSQNTHYFLSSLAINEGWNIYRMILNSWIHAHFTIHCKKISVCSKVLCRMIKNHNDNNIKCKHMLVDEYC